MMASIFDNAWDWLSKGDNLKTVGTIGGAVASGYGTYQQSKLAKDILNMQKNEYNRNVAIDDKTQENIDKAFNSVYEKPKKKDTSMDIGA
jgi:hypothetical protein